MTFSQKLKRVRNCYVRFVEKQGFPIIMGVCVSVIVFSAVWSGRMDHTLPTPTPPIEHAQSAAGLKQESLHDAVRPTPSPAPATELTWHAPLEKMIVLTPFQQARMIRSPVSGIWQVHDGCDLQAAYGTAVRSIGNGTLLTCTDEGILGVSVTVDHENGYMSTYANLSATAGLKTGDPVKAGQTIGFIGQSMPGETHLDAHLHLTVQRSGICLDPMLLFQDK